MHSYKESCRIMFTPYAIIALLWVPLCLITEFFVSDTLWVIAVVDTLATVLVFCWSLYFKNTSAYDPYWHLPPLLMLAYWAVKVGYSAKNMWVLLLPLYYFIRHNYNYFSFWPGMQYEDFRYLRFQKQFPHPLIYWVFSLVGLHLIPTSMVFFGLYPTYYALIEQSPYNPILFYLGVVVAIGGVTFEAIADMQLQPWRSNKSTDYIDVGLWRYSRHPNYFGECIFWWGTYIQALSFGTHLWFTGVGAIYMQLLFLFYSIPVMEKHLLAKRPSYALQQKRVSIYIPWFRKDKLKI